MQPTPDGTLADYWIGDFDFISMDGFPETAKQQPATEARPGTHGHSLWLTGVRGNPFQIITWRDVANMLDAADAYLNYINAIGTTLPVMYAGRPFDTLFDILNVEAAGKDSVISTIGGIGGREGISNALIICRWTMQAVYPFDANP